MKKNPLDFGFKLPKISPLDYNQKGKKVRVPVGIGLQKEIFIRAKGHCEKCGKSLKGLRPHIHHKDKNPKHNNKSNLILLCPDCHSRQHLRDKPNNPKPPRQSPLRGMFTLPKPKKNPYPF